MNFSIDDSIKYEDANRELVARLKDAVDIRLISDVPLGAFLSGGVDSSAVVAMMSQLSSDSVKTCSISFGESNFDESKYANEVAQFYSTDHQVKVVDPNDFSLLDQLANIYDEPFADSSAIPTYRVCELAKNRVTVALSGDGGDENFAGYRRYKWHGFEENIRRILPVGVRKPIFSLAAKIYPKADWAPKVFRAKTTFQALAQHSIDAYFNNMAVVDNVMRRKLFNESFHRELQGYSAHQVLLNYANTANIENPISLVQYLDFKTYLPGDILTKVDRASMANSLEVRVPILDHKFVEWAATLPPNFKLKGQEGKYILKHSLKKHLPEKHSI